LVVDSTILSECVRLGRARVGSSQVLQCMMIWVI
jgi:hypothetical protein